MPSDDPFSEPSRDAGDDAGGLAGALRSVLGKFLQNVDDCLPAIVTAVSADRRRVSVRPAVMMGTTDGKKVARAVIPSVPVLTLGGGEFLLSFPIKAGDFGWLKANDRDTSLFHQGLKEDWPNTKRSHSFNDGFFIPDIMRQWTLAGEDAERMVLQNVDGTVRIAIGADKIKITHPALVEIDAPDVNLTGNLTAAGHVTGAGIVLDTHHHSDPQGGETGDPT